MLRYKCLLISLALVSLFACRGGEQQILDRFFTAVQSCDKSVSKPFRW